MKISENQKRRPALALLFNLLIPGLGHIYWREYLFGLFVFGVCLIAAILFFLSLFLPLSGIARLILLGLPITFYIFSFFDLARVVKRRRESYSPGFRLGVLLGVAGLIYQIFSPMAPLNFALINSPEIYRIDSNRLNPVFSEGDYVKSSSLAYIIDLVFFDRPFMHTPPERYDIVRFRSVDADLATGIVIGLPREQIALIDGRIVTGHISDATAQPPPMPLSGDWPLTYSGSHSILVAMMNMGVVESVVEVSLADVSGKVAHLF